MSAEHFDSYGHGDREVYRSPNPPKPGFTGFWQGDDQNTEPQHRYLIWVHYTMGEATGLRRTYRTLLGAKLRAHVLERQGYAVKIADRKILPGDFGFLADRSGAYWMEPDGTLHTGPFHEMQDLVKANGGA